MEHLLHQGPAEFLLLFLRLEHAFQGRLQVVGHLVDDVVAANLHAELFGQRSGAFVGNHRETDDDGVGGVGQVDVGLADAAHRGLQDLDLHLGVLELLTAPCEWPRSNRARRRGG